MSTGIESRNSRCGASDAAAILGLSPYRSAYETWLEKTGRLEPGKGSDATSMGQRLESPILDVAEAELGPLSRGDLVWLPRLALPLASTLDARVKATGIPCEAKTSGIVGPLYGTWGDDGSDAVPESYLVQVTLQMVCCEADMAHLYALLGGRGIVRYRVLRDDDLANTLVDRLARWWDRHIVQGIEPPRDEPVPLEVAKRLRKTPHKVTTFSDEQMQLVYGWMGARSAKSAAEKACDEAQAALLLALGESEAASLPDGTTLTHCEQFRKGYTTKDTSFRVLRIKRG